MEEILSNLAGDSCIPLTLNVNCAVDKIKYDPRLNTVTVLWWLQPTPEMGLASGFETYLTAYCSYQTKRKQKMKNIKTKVIRAYAEVPEGETEVWAICTAPLLGTRK